LSTTLERKKFVSEKFGEKLRRIRSEKSITLEDLASSVGSSKAYVWQLENKKNAKPSADLLLKIANFLGQSPDFFLDDSRDEPDVNQLEDQFFRKFKNLSESDKRTIARIASGFDNES
jgi:transcriptional regulator with XRE-family HTH domain